jgi:archaellum biogenesis protein FlaJ (TadC family)
LSLRDQLRNSLQKDGKQDKRGTWHSKAYHRFFEGYSEITVPEPNGKGYRIQRIYTGNYYRQDLMKSRRTLLRILYVALFLGAVYLFVSSAVLPLASNSTWYVVLPQVVSIPFLFWILIAFFYYLPAKRDLTINGYRSSSLALQKATLGAAVSLGIAAFATLVFVQLNLSGEHSGELLCAVKYLAGGLLALSMNRIEKKVNYLIIPSQNKLPVDGK